MTRVSMALVRAYMWVTRRLVCRQAVALMSDYLEGNLTERDATRLEHHLTRCAHCTEYLAQLRVTIEALGAATPDALPDQALDELVELYRRWRAEPA
jgi:anti-sigma factor RsiW